MQESFVAASDANTAPISDFWTKLASDPQLGPVVPQLQLTLQLGTLTSNNPDLAAKLVAQFNPSSLRDLTKVSSSQLIQMMLAENVPVPASIAATTTPATVAEYANSIVGMLKQAFPTDFVAQSFSSSTDTANQAVATFLNKSPDFDLSATHMNKYLAANPASVAGLTADQVTTLTGRLKATQRVFRVTEDGSTMPGLIAQGVDSAYAIASKTSGTFSKNYATAVGGQDQAAQIHANATAITATTNLVIRQAQENSSGVMSRVIQTSKDHGPLDDALPNWQELFGTASTCKCCECRAIDGPAAYFVSLLQFLGNLTPNNITPNGGGNTPLDVLIGSSSSKHGNVKIGRRPDLAHLKLNCSNADTAMPYVDLVNEILENYVANGHVSDDNVPDTPADATTAVLDVTPEYTQSSNAVAAYNALNAGTIVYPHTLPFDRYLATVRIYLNSLGVSLYQLMQAFGTPAPALQTAMQLAAEYLQISLPEYELIAAPRTSRAAASPFLLSSQAISAMMHHRHH